MLLYPDTSDLINLCIGRAAIDISDLACGFAVKSHLITFFLETLVELAAPLRNGHSLEIRQNLNRLEELPHVFVNEARIYDMELRKAVSAFQEGREYGFSSVKAFAPRLDQAIHIHTVRLYTWQNGGDEYQQA
jgi:hypothetical protein